MYLGTRDKEGEMDTIKFANGSVFNCSFLATIPDGNGTAYIALTDVGFAQAAQIFSNPSMTREMEYANYRLVGYTELVMLGVQPYGIQAVLRRQR